MTRVFQGLQIATRCPWKRSFQRSISKVQVEEMGTSQNTVEMKDAHGEISDRISEKQSEYSGQIHFTRIEQRES